MGFDNRTYAAAVIDMAVKGFLVIRQVGVNYTLELADTGKASLLTDGERAVARALFGAGYHTRSIQVDNENHDRFSKARNALKETLKTEYRNATPYQCPAHGPGAGWVWSNNGRRSSRRTPGSGAFRGILPTGVVHGHRLECGAPGYLQPRPGLIPGHVHRVRFRGTVVLGREPVRRGWGRLLVASLRSAQKTLAAIGDLAAVALILIVGRLVSALHGGIANTLLMMESLERLEGETLPEIRRRAAGQEQGGRTRHGHPPDPTHFRHADTCLPRAVFHLL